MENLIELALQAMAQAAGDKKSATANAAPAMPPRTPLQAPSTLRVAQDRPAPSPPEVSSLRPAGPGTSALPEMFRDGNSLVRAIIAAEVLGPPRALGESIYWQTSRRSEPSN